MQYVYKNWQWVLTNYAWCIMRQVYISRFFWIKAEVKVSGSLLLVVMTFTHSSKPIEIIHLISRHQKCSGPLRPQVCIFFWYRICNKNHTNQQLIASLVRWLDFTSTDLPLISILSKYTDFLPLKFGKIQILFLKFWWITDFFSGMQKAFL